MGDNKPSGEESGVTRVGHRYWVVRSNPHEEGPPDMVFLDTNVAIDFKHFYFGESTQHKGDIELLLNRFPSTGTFTDIDLNHGWALHEAGWSRDGERRDTRKHRWAVEVMTSWPKELINREFAENAPPITRDELWERGQHLDLGGSDVHPLGYLCGGYAVLLHTLELARTRNRWRPKGVTWALRELRDWMLGTLGVQVPYEFAAAVDMLCGEGKAQSIMNRLFKYGDGSEPPDELADKAWNAAWDFLFVRLTNGAHHLIGSGELPERAALVTTNHDPWTIARRTYPQGTVLAGDGEGAVVFTAWDSSSVRRGVPGVRELLEERLAPGEEARRFFRDRAVVFEQALVALEELEERMGVERSTVAAFRRSMVEYEDKKPSYDHPGKQLLSEIRVNPLSDDPVNSAEPVVQLNRPPRLRGRTVPSPYKQHVAMPLLIVDLDDPDDLHAVEVLRQLEGLGMARGGSPVSVTPKGWGYILWSGHIFLQTGRSDEKMLKLLFQKFLAPGEWFHLLPETPLMVYVLNARGEPITGELITEKGREGALLVTALRGIVFPRYN